MKLGIWSYTLYCIFIHLGNFLLTNGETYLPKWSDQVETQLRFTASGMPQVIESTIYFDRKTNSIAITMEEMPERGKVREATTKIYRFEDGTKISISGHECEEALSIERENNSIQFLDGEKLKDFGSLLFFDAKNYAKQVSYERFNESYGFKTEWESRHVLINMTGIPDMYCNLTHYLANSYEEDKMNEENYFTIIVKIEGSCEVKQESDESVIMQFEANFIDSKNSISNAEIFQQPPGVYCPSVKTVKEIPQMPLYFSFNFLTLDSDDELNVHLPIVSFRKKVWYDSPNKLIRKDNLDWDFDVIVTMISDFNSKLSYLISSSGKCTINEMKASDTMENQIALPGENFPLFPESKTDDPQYVGQRKRYGITFDVWVSRNKIEETTQISDYYFTSNVLSEDNTNVTSPAFIEMFIFDPEDRLVGSALQLISEYRTKPSMQDQSTFDVTRCFPESNKTRFSLAFVIKNSSDFGEINQISLTNGARKKLLSEMKVNNMRLGAVQISFMDENSIVISSVLAEDPTRLGYKQATHETSNEEAMKVLDELINDKKLLLFDDTLNITLTANKLIYPHKEDNKDNKNNDTKGGAKKGFSGGALAGVGIAMLAVGMFQGIVLLVAYIKYRRNDPLVRKLTASAETPEPKPQSP